MKLPSPFLQLPLRFDSAALAAEIDALGEGPWRPHPAGFPGNSMLPLLALGGNAADEGYAGSMLPTPELLRCPYLVKVLATLGATLGRTRLMRLAGHAEVTRHVDQGYYWAERVRVHVPISTQPTVRFECGDEAINMAQGECWIFDTWRQHRVLNDAVLPRTHLVVDTVGGTGFWSLVARGRAVPGATPPDWSTTLVPPGPADPSTLVLENVNIPAIMSPWEVERQLRLVLEEAVPHASLEWLQARCRQFVLGWRGLWAHHGDAAAGAPAYRAALAGFVQEIEPVARTMQLRNGVNCMSAVITLVAKVAVAAT